MIHLYRALPMVFALLPLLAQDQLAPANSWDVDEAIVVTAQMEPVSAQGSIVAVEVLPLSRIKALAATNLDELLSHQLGFRLDQHSVFGSSPTIRGISGENVQILLDGVPVVGRLNGIIDLSHIVLDGVTQVEVIEGPASVYYGTDALGGVVNLITGGQTDGSKVSVHSRYDSVGDLLVAPRASYFNGKHSLSLGLGRKSFDGYDSDLTSAKRDFNERGQDQADISYGLHLATWDLRYNASLFDEQLDEPNVSRSGAPLLNTYETRRTNHQFSLSGSAGPGSLDLSLAFADYQRDVTPYQITDNGAVAGVLDRTTFDQWLARGSFIAPGRGKLTSWQLGFETTFVEGEAPRLAEGGQKSEDLALFASLRWQVSPRFTLQPALRATSNSNYSVPLTPALHAYLTDVGAGELRASVSRGFRGPSLKEQYLDFTVPAGPLTYHILGNETLQSEDGWHYDMSHVLRGEKYATHWRLQSELYYHDIDNMIALGNVEPAANNPGHLNRFYLNINQNRGYGGEIKLALNRQRWDAVCGISHTRSSNQLSATADVEQYNGRTDLLLELGVQTAPAQLRLFYRGNGESEGYFLSGSEVHAEKIEAYHLVDLSANRSLGKFLDLTVGGRNLLDVTSLDAVDVNAGQAHATNLIGWGRTWFVDLRLQWGK